MKEKNQCDAALKILVVGDSNVGKTNILLRLCNNQYRPNHLATMGIDFCKKTLTVKGKKVVMQIWDTAGQDRFRTITQNYYNGSSGVFLVYSVSDRKSFERTQNWMKQILSHVKEGVPIVLLGNKCDIEDQQRLVTKAEGQSVSKQLSVPFFQTSSKQNINVLEAFQTMAQLCSEHLIEPSKPKAISLGDKADNLKKKCCN